MRAGWIGAVGFGLLVAMLPMAACEDDPIASFAFDAGGPTFEASAAAPPPQVAAPADDGGVDAASDAETFTAAPKCDDGKLDPGEVCDPLSTCPTTCANDKCQQKQLVGGGTCNAHCEDTTLISACVNGDGCCPPGCNATNDSDCVAKCDNGVIEGTEACDPLSSCPAACPALGCQQRALQGGGSCDAKCVNTTLITACVNGDGCCPVGAGCNATNDSDCAPGCGNNIVEAGEKCDPLSSCPVACAPIACQKRKLINGGTCQAECVNDTVETACKNDDGCCPTGCNANNDNDCKPSCGNGIVEPGEKCDGASCPVACASKGCQKFKLINAGTCLAECVADTLETECKADDNCCPGKCNANTDNDCKPSCPNGVVEPGETCDPPASCGRCVVPKYTCLERKGGAATCDLVCQAPISDCTRGDSCCPFTAAGGCTAENDGECKGKWDWMQWPDIVDTEKTACVDILIHNIEGGGSYDFTTCAPPGSAGVGNGDIAITAINDDLKNNYDMGNDNCTDPSALPNIAGSECHNKEGALAQACASPSPGGFIINAGATSVTVQICRADRTSKGGRTPLYIWYNATKKPGKG